MNPTYTRLVEMAIDMGSKIPVPNTFFQEHLALSSGRVSQLRKPWSLEKVGPKTLIKIEALGYSPAYIQDGVGELKQTPAVQQDPTAELLAQMPPAKAAKLRLQIRYEYELWKLEEAETHASHEHHREYDCKQPPPKKRHSS